MGARHLAVSAVLSLGAVLAHGQDQSLAGFKAPALPPVHAASPAPPTPSSLQGAPPGASNVEAASPLPARVLLVMPHTSVRADGSGLVFNFDHASLPEVVSAIGRGFGIGLAYSGPTEQPISGQWRCDRPEEALSHLVDRTSLQFRFDGGVWSVGEMAREAPATIGFSVLVKQGAAPPAQDGAPARVPAKPGR